MISTLVKQQKLWSSEKSKQLQLSLPNDTPSSSQDVTHAEEEDDESVNLDEVITLPKYDLNNLKLEKMQELQVLLSCKEKQDQLKIE